MTSVTEAANRPRLLLVASGMRAYREYLLASIGSSYQVHLFHTVEPTWERPYLDGWTVLDSTVDGPAMAATARGLHDAAPFDGVLCWDEGRIHATAHIAQELKCRNGDPMVIWRLRDKAQTRQALRHAGVPQPASVEVSTVQQACAAADSIGYPIILKPRGLGASLGVVRVDDAEALHRFFPFTRNTRPPDPVYYSTDGPVLVEECLIGDEISVDAVVTDGRVVPMFIGRKSVGFPPYAEEIGHLVDATDPLLDDDEFRVLLQHTHDTLGFRDGWTHTEFMLTAQGPHLIEVNGRLGGDLIPYLGMLATGLDPAQIAAAAACGRSSASVPTRRQVAGVRFFYVDADDTTIGTVTIDRALLPAAVDRAVVLAEPGLTVSPPPKGTLWGRIAYVTAVADTAQECRSALLKAAGAVRYTEV
ncbi:ATP-grasp domain-containing protein [Micromonospora sp. HNM0581]|uniref:ATP-grasp domain-containing protein n=1 Tax=Micromonospora sp. HNM0581 TaxID=2716341 RepID=UPI001469DD6B|nr:ATP-grasp domain-containing protein [Micromonospora sp. HNM0581]NLU80660.1 ATP-grasp domain-containing protein [Micromonospora sp. HNM0581]